VSISDFLRRWRRGSSCGIDPVSLSAYADGQLDGAARATVERHIDACGRCRSQLTELRWLTAQLVESLAWPPLGAEERTRGLAQVRDRIDELRLGEAPAWERWLRFPEGPVPVMAAALLVLVALADTMSFGGLEDVAFILALYLELI